MSLISRLNKPWLHFIALGIALFLLQGWLFPEPKPVIGPLGEARMDALRQQWFSSTGRLPAPDQEQRMAAAELDRDMLFQRALDLDLHRYDTVVYQRLLRNMHFLQLAEGKTDAQLYQQALEMRLHLGDEVIKRRMIQVMEQLLLAGHPPRAVSDEAVAASFAERKEELRRPPRYSIEHLYFNREREAQIEQVIETISEQGLSATQARTLSSPFLPGYVFNRQTPDQLARHFGAGFVMNLEKSQPEAGRWVGPVQSTYGQHYVWVSEIETARDARLDEVEAMLRRDLEALAKAQALEEAIERMREEYEVRT